MTHLIPFIDTRGRAVLNISWMEVQAVINGPNMWAYANPMGPIIGQPTGPLQSNIDLRPEFPKNRSKGVFDTWNDDLTQSFSTSQEEWNLSGSTKKEFLHCQQLYNCQCYKQTKNRKKAPFQEIILLCFFPFRYCELGRIHCIITQPLNVGRT